jgi:hypothetical protein
MVRAQSRVVFCSFQLGEEECAGGVRTRASGGGRVGRRGEREGRARPEKERVADLVWAALAMAAEGPLALQLYWRSAGFTEAIDMEIEEATR